MTLRNKVGFFLHKNYKYLAAVMLVFTILIAIGIISMIYSDIQVQTSTNYCYAFFAANAIAANCLFGLGRSNVFIIRFPDISDQKKIYRAGILFLTSALIALSMAGVTYLEFSSSMPHLSDGLLRKIVYGSVSIYFSAGIILSVIAVFNFMSWAKKAFEMYSDELRSENEKLGI